MNGPIRCSSLSLKCEEHLKIYVAKASGLCSICLEFGYSENKTKNYHSEQCNFQEEFRTVKA
jgi:hypothetical protein